MNAADFTVIAIMLVCGIMGLVNGFVHSAFRIASFFIAIIIAISMYPVLASFITSNTNMHTSIKTYINDRMGSSENNKQTASQNETTKKKSEEKSIDLSMLPLPENFKKQIESYKIKDTIDTLPLEKEKFNNNSNTIADTFANNIINIISMIIIFIVIRIALAFVRVILECVAKLPIFNQLNKMGGFVFGILEGVLMAYLICAVLTVFTTFSQFEGTFKMINTSLYAKNIYYNNFLLNWVLTKTW